MSNFDSWRVRSVRTFLAAVTASALMVSGAVFAVSASAANGATQIVIKTQPSTTATSGVALAQQPTVWIADANGTAVSGISSAVTATITSQNSSSQLANATVNAVNGVATFSNLTLNTLAGTYTLTFTDTTDSVTSSASTSITVSAGAATQLVVTTQPSPGEVTGNALVTQPVVKVEDVNGNPVTTIGTGTVVASTSSAGCAVSSSGATSGTITAGVATFSGLTMTGTSGTSCVLTFTYLSLPTVNSASVLMSNAATHLVVTTQPSTTTASGAALSQQPVVKIYDGVPTQVMSDTSTVTATITSGTGTVTNATAVAVAGVATFSGLALNAAAGTYTLTFTDGSLTSTTSTQITVGVGAAAKLAVLIQPSTTTASGATLVQVPRVTVVDSGGNLVTSNSAVITAAFTSGGVSITNPTATASSGVATFTGMALNALVGSYTLTFSAPSLTAAVSAPVYVSVGAATKLAITTQPPTSVASGVAMTTQPVVKIVDSGGNVVTSNNSTVIATVTSGTYSLSSPAATAVAGTASFSGLALNAPVGTYTITFSDGALTPTVSNLVAVTSGAPTHLVITTQPSPTQASGVALAVVPVVKVEDVAGNVVTADGSVVSAKITSGGVSVTNGAQTAVNGVATFTGLALNAKVGTYTLTFTDGTMSAAVSTNVTVYVGPATQLVVVTEPSAVAQSGVALTTQPVVAVRDSGGNVVTSVNSGYVTVGIASGSAGVVSAGAVAPFVSGTASFSGLAITGTNGATYGLVFTGAGFSVIDASRVTLGTAQSPLIITTQRATYGRNLRLATRGGSGTGPVTYAVVNGTATGCRLNGVVLFYSRPGTCIVTATKAASGNYLAVSSSPTTVTVAILPIPHVVNVYFFGNSTGLTNQARHSLILLARQLTSASHVRILGFAPHNLRLAHARAVVVKNFLNARVHSHFQMVNQTNTRLQSVRVITLSQR